MCLRRPESLTQTLRSAVLSAELRGAAQAFFARRRVNRLREERRMRRAQSDRDFSLANFIMTRFGSCDSVPVWF